MGISADECYGFTIKRELKKRNKRQDGTLPAGAENCARERRLENSSETGEESDG